MSSTISTLAGEALNWFERRERGDESIWATRDDAPEWVRDLVYSAHGDFLPEDWRYDAIRSALSHISDSEAESADDLDDDVHEFADSNVDVYNADRFRWLASNLNRAGYVDEAVENFGHSDQGVTGDIGLGQYAELGEVFSSVVESLRERMDELEAETAEQDA